MKAASTITRNELIELANHASSCGYDEERKEKYRKLGRKILKAIATQLGLQKGEFDIRWNPGGPAVSGDHTLHTDKFYLALHDNLGSGWFYYRTCQGRKDYTGGPNHTYPWVRLTAYGLSALVDVLRVCQTGQWKDPQSGDIICNVEQAIGLCMREQNEKLHAKCVAIYG